MASVGPTSPAKGFIAELDGLRGVAILLVMVHRFWPRTGTGPMADAAGAGWIGVDLFFVISGFLIAGILLDTRGEPGYFRNFYARRVLRIFPLYYLFVGGVLIAFSSNPEFREHSGSPLWYLFHLGNVPEGMLNKDVPYWLAPVWSLAIEEQFYLTFPLLVAAVAPHRLGRVLVALIIAAPLIRLATMLAAPDRERIQYLFTLCRLDTIAVGCLLAVVFRSIDLEKWRETIVRSAAVIVAVAVLFSLDTGLDRTTAVGRTLGYTVVAFGCAAVVALTVLYRGQHETASLRFAPLAYLGKLCFGLYLLHRPADTIVSAVAARAGIDAAIWLIPVKVAFAVVLATISWRLVERPFLRLKNLFSSDRHPAAASRAVLLGGIVLLLAACSSRSPSTEPPGDDEPPRVDASTPDELDIPDDAMIAGGPVVYPFDRRHSPITPAVVTRLQGIASAGARSPRVFAKVGDSITAAQDFLRCYGSPDLGAHAHLASTIDYYKAGNAAGATPFTRSSFVAVGGTTADAPLTGSPCALDREISAIDPQLAVIMFGTNDVRYGRSVDDFATDLWNLVDLTLMRGVIPTLSTIPPINNYAEADARIPVFNLAIRAIAQGKVIPLVDYHRDIVALPNRGMSSDGIHPSKASNACDLSASALAYGYNLRNLITLELLARVKAAVAGTASDSAAPHRSGTGSANDPVVASLPLADMADARTAASVTMCGKTGNTVVYELQLAQQRAVEVHVVDRGATDVDIAVLSGSNCIAQGDRSVTTTAGPGTVRIAVRANNAGEFLLLAR